MKRMLLYVHLHLHVYNYNLFVREDEASGIEGGNGDFLALIINTFPGY
jgi:hypothetical protein